jgi:DNA-binding beta-propeller fold protein YncE
MKALFLCFLTAGVCFTECVGQEKSLSLKSAQRITTNKSDEIFISSDECHCVWRLSQTGQSDLIAGVGKNGFSGDGDLAINAQLDSPQGLAFDRDGNLYIADAGNNRIRKVDFKSGIITTVAGNGKAELSGDGRLAIEAGLRKPRGLTFDQSGNLLIADTDNRRIRRVDMQSGKIMTIAGRDVPDTKIKSEEVFEFKLMMIYIFSNEIGDGKKATDAYILDPSDLAVDDKGNVYIADGHGRIRIIKSKNGRIGTWFRCRGTASIREERLWGLGWKPEDDEKRPDYPLALRLTPSGKIFFTTLRDGVYAVTLKKRKSQIIIEQRTYNQAANPYIRFPSLAVDSMGNVLIVDRRTGCIEKINSQTGEIQKLFCQ